MKSNFNEQDSLRVINEMIAQVNSNIQIGAADSMIRSGYAVIAISVLNIILLYTLPNPAMSFFVWTLMLPISIIGLLIDRKKNKEALIKTHIDTIIAKAWKAFGWSICIFLLSVFSMSIAMDDWRLTVLIMPVIMILTGLVEYITGIASRFKPFLQGAFIFWIGAGLCIVLLFIDAQCYVAGQFILLAICMITGFCIPGHTLNRKANNQ